MRCLRGYRQVICSHYPASAAIHSTLGIMQALSGKMQQRCVGFKASVAPRQGSARPCVQARAAKDDAKVGSVLNAGTDCLEHAVGWTRNSHLPCTLMHTGGPVAAGARGARPGHCSHHRSHIAVAAGAFGDGGPAHPGATGCQGKRPCLGLTIPPTTSTAALQFAPPAEARLTAGDPIKNASAILRYALPIDNKPIREIQVGPADSLHHACTVRVPGCV